MRAAAENCETGGRRLFATFASLPWPDPQDRHRVLWHGFNLLREHGGDCQVASLVASDIDPCECHMMRAAGGLGGGSATPRVAATCRWERRQGPAGAERLAELAQEPVRVLRSGRSLAEIEDVQNS